MISTAFPLERDILREFGSNATVMRGGRVGGGFLLVRSCAIASSFGYFFLSFFEDIF